MLGEGPDDAVAVLVGDAPGREDAEQQRPFTGTVGSELNGALQKAGLKRGRLYLLYTAACQPPPGKSETKMARAIACCAPLFNKQLPPALPVFAMGKWAVRAVTGREKASMSTRGFLRKTPDGRDMIVSWNPAYAAFHAPHEWAAFEIDLDRFGRLLTGNIEKEPTIVADARAADVIALHQRAREAHLSIAVDIETAGLKGKPWTGKDPTQARLKTIGFGTADYGLSVWWRDASPAMRKAIAALLHDDEVQKIFHNGHWFDLRVLARYGLAVQNVVDTRDARRALSATSRLSLAYLTSLYADLRLWKSNEDEK